LIPLTLKIHNDNSLDLASPQFLRKIHGCNLVASIYRLSLILTFERAMKKGRAKAFKAAHPLSLRQKLFHLLTLKHNLPALRRTKAPLTGAARRV